VADNCATELLNFDNISEVLNHSSNLIKSKFECHVNVGLKSAINILKTFSKTMLAMKKAPVFGGVDLAREDRMKKCDSCID
jgi:hypothetical protein